MTTTTDDSKELTLTTTYLDNENKRIKNVVVEQESESTINKVTTLISGNKLICTTNQSDNILSISKCIEANSNREILSQTTLITDENTTVNYHDGIGHLVRENNKKSNQTIVYSYDLGGNILESSIYDYSTNSNLVNKKSSDIYEYEHPSWKDLLTAYNGDVISLYNNQGTKLVTYSYDAWDNTLSIDGDTELGNKNPIHYRSYYIDQQTGFYYLQSRYYDSTIKRFINADSQFDTNSETLSYNLYTYCSNNPILYKDNNGNGILTCILIGAAVGAVLGAIGSKVITGKVKISWIAGGVVVGTLCAGGYYVYTTYYGVSTSWAAYKAAQVAALNESGKKISSQFVGSMYEK